MTEETTLETLDGKLDLIIDNTGSIADILDNIITAIDKEDEIINILNAHTTAINSILNIVSNIGSPSESEEPITEATSQFKTDLQAKIDEGLPYDQVKAWILGVLALQGIYSEADINIKLFTDIKGNIIFEVKTRPYVYMGRLLQFLRDSMGEADKFETSRYTMNLIMWWELTRNQQMEDMGSTTDIVDDVNEQWGDNDQVDFNNG